MSNTPNLNIPLVETNQSQKEVTMNSAIWGFERALTESTEIECDDGTTVVTDEEAREAVHLLLAEGSLSAPFTVELPAIKRVLVVTNATDQDATIVCSGAESGSAEASLPAGATTFVYCDEAQVFAASPGGDPVEQQALSINAQTGTSYTLDLSDAGALVTLDNASPVAITVPDNGDTAFPVGTSILLAQIGAGQVTVTEGTSVTVVTPETLKLRKQGAQAALVKIATDTWLLDGNLEAA